MKITDDDLPAFYKSNDKASAWAQSWYLCLTRLHLGLLVAVAIISGFTAKLQTNQHYLAYAIAALIVMAFAVAITKRALRFEQRWYHFRALAESAKSAAWRYMMHAAGNEEERQAAELLTERIKDLRDRFADVARCPAKFSVADAEITEGMRQVQRMDLSDKLHLFCQDRLLDQHGFYHSKHLTNARDERVWFLAMLVAQAAVLVCALAHAWCLWRFNPVGALSALAAAFVAWTQTKRHADLAGSYAAATHDLQLLHDREVRHVDTQDRLDRFVEDVESTCSREHSLWLVRRGG